MIIDNLKKLNCFVASGEFMNAYNFINPDYTLTYIIDIKGTGKTYAFMNLCVDKMLEGDEFAWIRNTKVEFDNSRVADSFNTIFKNRGILDKYIATEKGVYKLIKVGERKEQKILVALFVYMSKPLATSSQNALTKCKWIIWDEFINPDFNKPNLFENAIKVFDTLKRNNVAYVFLLGNKHTTSSDMLEGSGCEFRWESNENQVYFDKESSTQGFYIGQHKITAKEASLSQIKKWGKYNYATNSFYSGHASIVPNKHVVNWERNEVYKIFTPLWKFTVNKQDFCLGKLTNGCFYIKSLFHANEFEDVKGWFCFYPQDKTDYNVYLHPRKDKEHYKLIIDTYSNGILYYDWFNTQAVVIDRLLFFINLLEAPDKNTI